MEIVPAIIAKDFEELQQKIKLVEPYVNWVQLDVMDGKFVPEKTWPYFASTSVSSFAKVSEDKKATADKKASKGKNKPEDLKKVKTNLNLEVHLMVLEPEKEIEKWMSSGVKKVLVHFEATKHLDEIIKRVKKAGLEIGIVLNLETPIKVLNKFQVSSSKFQVIQLMAITEIGYYGHSFDERVIPRIKSLRQKYQNVKIAIDGGINNNTAKKVAQVGANILVVGSAIFKSQDIGRAIKELELIGV